RAVRQGGGVRAAFGSDGKSRQVGMAAGGGVLAARAAAGGARIRADAIGGPAGFAAALGGGAPAPPDRPAIADNWIKPWPCCLGTHGALEAASDLRDAGNGAPPGEPIEVTVHPLSRAAAAYDDVADGLQAKFSIPYVVAYTLLRGEPGPDSFAAVDPEARELAGARVRVRTDEALLESEAILALDGDVAARVRAARRSPGRPLDEAAPRE